MNEQLIIDMARPYVKDGFITYEEFNHIYEMLSLEEKDAVVDILYNNGIDRIDADEQDEDADDKFEVLYDDGLFKDTGFNAQNPKPVVVNEVVKQSNEILCAMIQQGNLQASRICV